ncbi:MAG: imelysin family protein [Bdellovibrionales bacterium]|nr:imelysin family protein [Bdellovibrionales bacterium]
MRFVFLLVLSASLLSCSDFTNKSSNNGTSGGGPIAPKPESGKNPFPEGFDPNAGEFSEANMLANIGLNVIAPQARLLRMNAEFLETSIAQMCEGLKTGSNESAGLEQTARARWEQTMLAFHKLDAAPVGPIMANGRFLADNIYGWPNFNGCGIDIEVVKLKDSGVPNHRLLFTTRGLGAVEYLLFENTLGTMCNPRNASHKPALEWAKLDAAEKKIDRCGFAVQIARDLSEHSRLLAEEWDRNNGNFSKTMIDGTRYKSVHEAVNALSDSIFSVETMKDQRLGRPLGLHKDCLSADGKCAELAEHPWSGLALQAMQARLQGFRAVLLGKSDFRDGYGFDDALKGMGRSDVTEHLLQWTDKALTTANETSKLGSLQEQIRAMNADECKATTVDNKLVPICALFREVRQLTVMMKTEFLTALSLRAPITHQGDND